MKETKIIHWNEKHRDDFEEINKKWLYKYDMMEDRDLEILNNPVDEIINIGGMIFFCKVGDEVAGTASLIPKDENTFEIAKVGVLEEFKSQGIGNLLIEYLLDYAHDKNAEFVVLYTSEELKAAVGLYEKHGFEEVKLEKDSEYETVDMKMQLKLRDLNHKY